MASRAFFSPLAAEYPSSNFAPMLFVNGRPVLTFDASTAKTAYWTFQVPQGFTGTPTLAVTYMMASATTGKVDFTVSVEAVTPGDSVDLDAGDSFDTANSITAPTVPGTAGYPGGFTCTLNNIDNAAAGDYMRIALTRAAASGNDTAAGDAYVLLAELRDSA